MNDTLDRLNDVFREAFDNEDVTVSPETTARDVEGWDSLMHVSLVVNIEKAFQMRFTASEIAGLKNVGDLLRLIDKRRSAKLALS